MKKAAIIVAASIYALAIIVVAFLGYQAEIHNPPVYADEIVMVQDVPYQHFENGVLIYTITQHEAKEESTENDLKYKYDVHIWDYEFLYECMDAQLNIQCKPKSHQVDDKGEQKKPDKSDLIYSIYPEDATVSNKGIVQFTNLKNYGSYDVVVTTIDTSNISIYVHIYW